MNFENKIEVQCFNCVYSKYGIIGCDKINCDIKYLFDLFSQKLYWDNLKWNPFMYTMATIK